MEIYCQKVAHSYRDLGNPGRAFVRDILGLEALKAVDYDENQKIISVRMQWPVEITETEFFKRIEQMPKAKTRIF